MKTQRQETISICGNQQALYVSATGTSAKSGQTKDEMLMTTIGGTTYMTLYARPLRDARERAGGSGVKKRL